MLVAPPAVTPTPAQQEALRRIVESAPGAVTLLHGITGSGKTLVYLEVLKEIVLRQGESAIVLVPEIALTPQAVDRFRAVFGDQVAVLHSGLSDGERLDAWRALQRGERRIAVGARSAIFAPLANLVRAAAAQTQVLLVSHAAGLIDALPDAHRIPLERHPDGTLVSGQGRLEGPPWNWGTR